VSDYIRDITQHAKNESDRPSMGACGCGQMGEISHPCSFCFIVIQNFAHASSQNHAGDFYAV